MVLTMMFCADEYVCQSRLTVCTSSAVATDQKPEPPGARAMAGLQ